ncbi:MAG: EutN/CcmL family microcompartment protein [Clostridiaceae bacterium]|nr:EutN/CcmL family microcompartment protein [Clostridiaceae bacterium]
MYICTVQGKCVSTIKNKKLAGYSLVIVQKLKKNGKASEDILVAVDTIGCSVGETVLVTSGQNAKYALDLKDVPVDAVIVGIVDTFDAN